MHAEPYIAKGVLACYPLPLRLIKPGKGNRDACKGPPTIALGRASRVEYRTNYSAFEL